MGRALVNRLLDANFRVVVCNRGRKYWGTRDPSNGRVCRIVADRRKTSVYAERIRDMTTLMGKDWNIVADFCGFEAKDVQCSLQGLDGRFGLYTFISSDSVYEVCELPANISEISESMSIRPADPSEQKRLRKADDYGDGKLACEEVLKQFTESRVAAGHPPPCIVALRLPDVIGAYDDTHRLFAYYWWIVLHLDEGFAPLAVSDSDVNIPIAVVFSDDVAATIAAFGSSGSSAKPGFHAIQIGCAEQMPLANFLQYFASAISSRWPHASMPGVFNCNVQQGRCRTFLPSVERKCALSFSRAQQIGFTPTPLMQVLTHCAEFFNFAMSHHPTEAFEAIGKLPKSLRKRIMRRHWVLPAKGLKAPNASDMSSSAPSSSGSDSETD
jgi:nucleoside-diphosphate-sugar epimerase